MLALFKWFLFDRSLLPAVQMWQEEWGAQAIPLTQARWLFRRATGVHGTLTSYGWNLFYFVVWQKEDITTNLSQFVFLFVILFFIWSDLVLSAHTEIKYTRRIEYIFVHLFHHSFEFFLLWEWTFLFYSYFLCGPNMIVYHVLYCEYQEKLATSLSQLAKKKKSNRSGLYFPFYLQNGRINNAMPSMFIVDC